MTPHAPGARLWLVRHAAPQVAPGTCYGALDMPADPAATQATARRLAAALPPAPGVFCSTLQRCEQLGQALCAGRPDLMLIPDARLREMDFGAWEGRAWSTLAKSDIDAWTEDFAHHAPGGGEPLSHMLGRVALALQAARQWSADHAGADVVWITHAGVARCVAWLQQHGEGVMPRPDNWPVAAPGWGEWEVRDLA